MYLYSVGDEPKTKRQVSIARGKGRTTAKRAVSSLQHAWAVVVDEVAAAISSHRRTVVAKARGKDIQAYASGRHFSGDVVVAIRSNFLLSFFDAPHCTSFWRR